MDNLKHSALEAIRDICQSALSPAPDVVQHVTGGEAPDGVSHECANLKAEPEPDQKSIEVWLQQCAEFVGASEDARKLAAAALGRVRYPRFDVEDFRLGDRFDTFSVDNLNSTRESIQHGREIPIVFRCATMARRILELAEIGRLEIESRAASDKLYAAVERAKA